MPVDPRADIARLVWVDCPYCASDADCAECRAGKNCAVHRSYLLESKGNQLYLECANCGLHWWHRTGFGAGRPADVDALPEFPESRWQ